MTLAKRLLLSFGVACAIALVPGLVRERFVSAQGASCLPPISNPIACENALPGNPESEWDVTGAGDATIQGFATDISVNHGQTVTFKVKTTASQYRIDIYRLGFYGGDGARKVATVQPSASLPQTQPSCLTDSATGLIDCGNWAASASWAVPASATSGVYLGRLVRTDTGGASHMVFIVRDDDNHSDLLFQAADTTWQAYNDYGGNSLYVGAPAGRAYKVSYNRPFTTRGNQYARAWLFDGDYPMIRWLEANGYWVSYSTATDTDRRGAELLEHKAFLSVGHDEYWSAGQRTNVEAARAAGVHLAFFSGNEMFWKTRWENSVSSPATSYRTLVSYKETHANAKIDPTSTWTGTWRDARFSPPSDGGQPENAVTGTIFMGNCCPTPLPIKVSAAQGKLRFWRNTSAATLGAGQTLDVAPGIVGYEFDADLDNGFRPQGLMRLSANTFTYGQTLLDNGSTYGNGTITHALTLYRHASGALVFGAGLTRWAWALDTTHDLDSATPNAVPTTSPVVQQVTVNLLADMGSQPFTLQPGLVAATQSSDTLGPTTTVSAPVNGSTVSVGTPLVMSGTATDSGGGIVTSVEVSVDNGATWKAATGLGTWSYNFAASGQVGTMTVRSRAVDDSGNIGAVTSVTLNVTAAVCPCTLWPASAVPAFVDTADVNPIELGVKFQSDLSGYITGLRFYKATTTTGTHIGNLWNSARTLLATATFSNETASGWQQVNFSTPVAISANTMYVASYHTNVGNYPYDPFYFQNTGVDRSPLHAPSEPASGGNGVFIYGPSAYPSDIYNANNYWVDVVFSTAADSVAPTIASSTPAGGATGVTPSTSVTATFSEGMTASTITTSTVVLRTPANAVVPSTVSYNAGTFTATLTPTSALAASTTYTVTVVGGASGVKDLASNPLLSNAVWSFTTAAVDTTPPTVTTLTPASGATGISTGTTVSATFSEGMTASTITGSTVVLRTPASTVVPATVAYNAGTFTATLTPTSALAASTTYTATVVSGASGVKDLSGNPLAADRVWTFTTGTAPTTTTLGLTTIGATMDAGDSNYLNGSLATTTAAGTVTSMSVYVGAIDSSATNRQYQLAIYTNVGGQPGALVASSASGTLVANSWNTIPVTATLQASTSYWLIYNTNGRTANVNNMPFNDVVAGQGVYSNAAVAMGTWPTTFPASTATTARYSIYATVSVASDTTAPTVTTVVPANGATGVSAASAVNVTFSEAMTASTITTSTVVLRTPASTVVPATVTFNAGTNTATLTPTSALTGTTTYTLTVTGGASGVKDLAANALAANFTSSFTTADATPPTVTGTTPASGATGISTNATVTATFSEAMTASTITTGTVVLRTPASTVVAATVSYNAGTNVATLTPSAALAQGTTYAATITGGSSGVKDVAGNPLASDLTWSFTTVDTTPPTITATVPASGATGVSLTGTVSATFSEAMNASTLTTSTVVLRTPASTVVPATLSYNAGTNTVTLTPTAALAGTTTYTATVTGGASGVKDVAGNALAANVVWSFTTADTTAPTITSRTPAAGATAVSPATTVTATFSEAMTASTMTTGTVVLRTPSSTVVTATVSYNAGTNVVTLTPTAALAQGVTYTATITGGAAGVKDLSGNPLAADAVWSFTTADTTAPTITARTPAIGATGVNPATTVTATFSEGMTAATITTGTVVLRTPANAVVPATVAYNAATFVATLTPTSALATSTTYTVTVVGGVSGAKDLAGNALASDAVWSFTTAAGDTTPPTVTTLTPASGATGVSAGTTVTATFSEGMTASTITTGTVVLRTPASTVVPATVAYNAATFVATLTPTSALAASTTYTATVVSGASGVKDLAGNALATDRVWSFTTAAAVPPTSTVGLTTIGGNPDSDDSNYLTGSIATATTAGTVTSMSVYVGAIDSSTTNRQYQLAIYTNSAGKPGTLVASSASGTLVANSWNTIPVTASLQAGTSYWLLYNTNGRTSAVNNMSYDVAASGQGIYSNANVTMGTWPTTFPASTLTTARYSVYATLSTGADTTAPTVTTVVPANGATGASTTVPVTVTFSEAMTASTITGSTIVLRTPASTVVPATVSFNAGTNTATLTPTSALAGTTTYTLTVTGGASGVKDLAGNALAANFTASFTTSAPVACPCSIWAASATPASVDTVDVSSIELGVKFQSDIAGFITAIRFYKAATNTGTHVASLWTAAGSLLATATFTGESASGWQQVSLPTPIAITAGATYVASYHATAGNYSYNAGYFATTGIDNGPLHAPSTAASGGNGVYLYGTSPAFPNQTFNGNNYWVDVVFTP